MVNESKITSFLNTLDVKLVEEIFNDFSREQRRKLSKHKNNNTKLKFIMQEQIMYNEFISKLYNKYRGKTKLKDDESYENIIQLVNKENFNEITIYILNRSIYDSNFNKLYLKKYFTSDSFKKYIDENAEEPQSQMESVVDMEKKIIDNSLTKYIGMISLQNNHFYNFYPKYKLINQELVNIENPSDYFPVYGNVYIEGNGSLSDLYHPMKQIYKDNRISVVEFNAETELVNNFKNGGELQGTNKKISGKLLIDKNRIQDVNDINIFKIVDAKNSDIDINSSRIDIEQNFLYEGERTLLRYGDDLYGPYKVGYDDDKEIFYLNTDIKSTYIIKKYIRNENSSDIRICTIDIDSVGNIIEVALLGDNCRPQYMDKITDEVLLDEFKKVLAYKDEGNLENDLGNLIDLYKRNSVFMCSDIDENIKTSRLKRLNDLLTNIKDTNDSIDDVVKNISDVISELILKYKDDNHSYYKTMIDSIISDSEVMLKLQNTKIAQYELNKLTEKCDEKKEELEKLKRDIDKQNKNNEQRKNEILKNMEKETKDEIEKMNTHLSELRNNKLELEKKIEQFKEIDKNIKDLSDLEKKIEQKKAIKSDLDKDCDKIVESLERKLDGKAENAVNYCFDGMITSKMLQKAYEWEIQEEKEQFKEYGEYLRKIKIYDKKDENLIQDLCKYVKKYRDYDRNTIINILICITQGFLTVFSGQPGIGKTSICKIIASALGLNLKNETIDIDRFVAVSVERGWTSKRDFIGYYNPLTKKFDQSNRKVFEGLKRLNFEGDKSTMPFLVLLDEANLSPMEYYWADFMSICDDRNEKSYISLGENYRFYIPDTLRFVATINNDHTTEVLSPRLIDRAWIISLPEVMEIKDEKLNFDDERVIINWNRLKETFSTENKENMNTEVKEIFDKIIELYRNNKIYINPRTYKAIINYWSVAQRVFENDKNGTDKTVVALDYAVSQRLLPKINGGGKGYKKFVEELLQICTKNNLVKSSNIINDILSNGEEMNFFQFFF